MAIIGIPGGVFWGMKISPLEERKATRMRIWRPVFPGVVKTGDISPGMRFLNQKFPLAPTDPSQGQDALQGAAGSPARKSISQIFAGLS
jgi:hypothetical protein